MSKQKINQLRPRQPLRLSVAGLLIGLMFLYSNQSVLCAFYQACYATTCCGKCECSKGGAEGSKASGGCCGTKEITPPAQDTLQWMVPSSCVLALASTHATASRDSWDFAGLSHLGQSSEPTQAVLSVFRI